MGLNDLAKRLISGPMGASGQTAGEARRLETLGRQLLNVAPLWPEGAEAPGRLNRMLDELDAALKKADGRLVMGLLGGTGVGKSTLISALAGEPISVSSVIRPTTSLPVIYRHADFPPLQMEGKEVVHEMEPLRCLAIVDFPDFDSLETIHHQVVAAHLRHLDLVVWVTDHHKYADRRFYEVMNQTALGAMSQAALLNKCDEILARPDGYEALNYIINSFAEHLRDYGRWQGPPPWPVSAAEAMKAPHNPTAGGLGPLRRRLDDLADDKFRRAVESGNLKARGRAFKEAVRAAAPVDLWLDRLEKLKKFHEDYQPSVPLGADLSLMAAQKYAYVTPRLTALKKKAAGLLALFTDGWDFIAHRFQPPPERPQAPPRPSAPAFARHQAGWQREFMALTGQGEEVDEETILKDTQRVIEGALARNIHDPKPGSALLWLWPLAWAVVLIWAEAGGVYTPAALLAAALRSAGPWIILAALGDAFLSRFIWFRVRRRYETGFFLALDEASEKLLKTAGERLSAPAADFKQKLTGALDLTAQLTREET